MSRIQDALPSLHAWVRLDCRPAGTVRPSVCWRSLYARLEPVVKGTVIFLPSTSQIQDRLLKLNKQRIPLSSLKAFCYA
ncbi:hypothetical protein SRHO_G00321780 [Serrasalmus rhombeus]